MQFKFTENTKSVREIHAMFKKQELIVDDSYQRRSVWIEKDQIRLIETMLLNFVIPSIYLWQSETDPDTGDVITHIVDGQQRIKAIINFIDNEFCLKENSIIEDSIKASYGNKYFTDLNNEIKKNIWNYRLSVIEIDLEAQKSDIIKMFDRLNLTEYTLNEQEKRNAIKGEFHKLAEEIASNNFWNDINFFTGQDVRRMNDVQFSATIILLWRNGIIEQSNTSLAINKAYEEFKLKYSEKESDHKNIIKAMEMIWELYDENSTKNFIKRKTQIYTIFSLCFYMIRKNLPIDDEIKSKFEIFVKIYNKYKNEEIATLSLSADENKVYDLFKKYKQASSEGINKFSNRVARFDVMKKFLLQNDYPQELMDSIYEKLDKS